ARTGHGRNGPRCRNAGGARGAMGRGQGRAAMIGFIRLAVFGFLAMSVVYILMSIYSRSVRREALEKEWDALHPAGDRTDERETHIEAGMKDYEKSLRKS